MTGCLDFTAASTLKTEKPNILPRPNSKQLTPDAHFHAGTSPRLRRHLRFRLLRITNSLPFPTCLSSQRKKLEVRRYTSFRKPQLFPHILSTSASGNLNTLQARLEKSRSGLLPQGEINQKDSSRWTWERNFLFPMKNTLE